VGEIGRGTGWERVGEIGRGTEGEEAVQARRNERILVAERMESMEGQDRVERDRNEQTGESATQAIVEREVEGDGWTRRTCRLWSMNRREGSR